MFAKNVVATSQPLAAGAGLEMLRAGGNAADAAVAAAIALTVVEPTATGIGGDAFALVWDGRRLHGLNGSGRSPAGWSPERFAGKTQMPLLGWDAVTVPGAVDAWRAVSKRFGKLPFDRLFEPAIRYATEGFIVTPVVANIWAEAPERYRNFPEFFKAFLPRGKPPATGEHFVCRDQAESLRKIAETEGEAFYRGELAERIAAAAAESSGAMTLQDLAEHASSWTDAISIAYRGKRLHEIPPNTQGVAALIALGILEHFDMAAHPPDSAHSIHLQVEAMKTAFVETSLHVADPESMVVRPERLLEDSFLGACAQSITMDRASRPTSRISADKGTVYLTAADDSGMMVSYIQSNYLGFGSGIVIPGTGISLHNRGAGFSLEKGRPNCVGGGKRPLHTIVPGLVTCGGKALMSFGVMGAHMQPQGHVQMMVRIFDHGQNPQAASDAPRWYVSEDFRLALEPGIDEEVVKELKRRGHCIIPDPPLRLFGGAQLIARLEDGYCAASDHRKDGQAVGY